MVELSNYTTQFIAGQWRLGQDSSHTIVDTDPYTGNKLTEIPGANQADVDQAYETAQKAQKQWGILPASARITVLDKALQIMDTKHEEIVSALVKESGSTRIKSEAELAFAINITKESRNIALHAEGKILQPAYSQQTNIAIREPLGVIGLISPWNFPFHLTMRSLAPALALGNAVVIKPASDTPITGGLLLGKIFAEAGVPDGVLNVVVGSGSVIGDYFVQHPIPKLISFTGSTAVGRGIGQKVMQTPVIKKTALELGGNAPFVVLDDADLDDAAHGAVVSKFLHQGQICMTANRLIVEEKIYDKFMLLLEKYVKNLKVGDPNDSKTVVGPIINKKQTAGILDKIKQAKEDGATEFIAGKHDGNLIWPTVLTNVDPDSEIAKEEIFGPVYPVIKVKDDQEALKVANDTNYGLSSSVYTSNMERGIAFARDIDTGMTHINDITPDDEPNVPFGGEKNSGVGRFNGEWVLDEFTKLHWITYQHEPHSYPF